MDEAVVDRNQLIGAPLVEAELVRAHAALGLDDMELTPDAVPVGLGSRHQLGCGCLRARPPQCLHQHLALHLQLLVVGGVLPLAAAALRDVPARREHAAGSRLKDLHRPGLEVVAAPGGDFSADPLAGEGIVDKNHLALGGAREGGGAVGHLPHRQLKPLR
jgi:hypothetical protein